MSDAHIQKPDDGHPVNTAATNEVNIEQENLESESRNGHENIGSESGDDNEDTPRGFDLAEKPQEELDSFDASQYPHNVDGSIDYNQIYDDLLGRFNQVYEVSQKLSLAEKTQRQTLYHYKRRINMLLDTMQHMEGDAEVVADEPLKIDGARISQLLTWRPELELTLRPVVQIAALETPDASQISLNPSYAVNLAVDEAMAEIAHDELDEVELNPQDTEMWTRRNFLHMVVSKFRPVEVTARCVREYEDPLSSASKRKKKA